VTCVCGCVVYLSLVCVALPNLTLVHSFVIIIVRARGSKLWRFLQTGKRLRKKAVVFKLIIGSLERG
jgi:hypothetical protein